jgi:two-component system sensor histidine kinase ChvG
MAKLNRLRDRVFSAAIAVTAAPFGFLVLMSRWEIRQAALTEQANRATFAALMALRDPGELEARARELGQQSNQRVRVITPQGDARLDVDFGTAPGFGFSVAEFFYGPVKPGLATVEGEWGPLASRPETGPDGESTRFAPAGNLLMNSIAGRLPDGSLLHVQGHSRRAALPELVRTRQVIKLSSFALALALLVGWLISRQLLKPLERLRLEVLARATVAVPKAGIDLGRSDEVGDLAEAFNTLLTALADRTKTNEAFLSDLAHELKNPVAAVRTSAELMAQGGLTPERVSKLTQGLLQSSAQLDRLVTQFLELARAEAGLPQEPRESLDVAALLTGLQAGFAVDPRFASVRWELSGLDARAPVQGIATRLERAFGNLLINALSFAGDQGLVRVSLTVDAGGVLVRIEDSGPGIDPTHLPRLFERFFTTRQERNGTGLGLALTRAIIEAHQGRVTAESPAGSGAVFSVTLPIA